MLSAKKVLKNLARAAQLIFSN